MKTTALYDRNVLSWLDQQPEEQVVVLQARDEGRLNLIYTHILEDELKPTDPEEARRLNTLRERLGGEFVLTPGMAFDISRFDQSTLFSDEDAATYDVLRVAEASGEGSDNNARDALLTLTAR
jgi:hypothetical protein